MGETINSPTGQEWSAGLSPDGNYLFFMKSLKDTAFGDLPVGPESLRRIAASPRNGDADIYWIRAGIIEKLRGAAAAR